MGSLQQPGLQPYYDAGSRWWKVAEMEGQAGSVDHAFRQAETHGPVMSQEWYGSDGAMLKVKLVSTCLDSCVCPWISSC